jgi:sphingomyelin phosphodiesterase acid-like 3
MVYKNIKSLGLVVVLVIQLFLMGCSGRNSDPPTATSFPVLVFTDIHFNPFYDTTLFQELNTAAPSQWAGIFQSSSVKAPSPWLQDTNYPLLALTLSSVKQNLGGSPFVIFTGDLLGHNLPQTFFAHYDPANASNPTAQDIAAMKAFTDKTVAFVMQQVRASVGNVPVLFALGNADSYTGLGPDATFLSNTVQLFYSQFLNGSVDQQTFVSTFTGGGYYSADVVNTNLTIIGLNTFEFSPPNPYMGDMSSAVNAELAWLDSALASAQARGRIVWLLMHVPPGADETTTSHSVDANGHIATATMMWNGNYQDVFLQTLAKYPGLITFILGAHTHMDEYRIISPRNVLEITPSIAPYFGNNPAFKIFTFSKATLTALDYTVLNCDLTINPPQFAGYYTFSTAYGMHGPLNDSLTKLNPELVIDNTKQALYRQHYYSGRAYSSGFSPVTDLNWPVFWSGIGNMDDQSFMMGVNYY